MRTGRLAAAAAALLVLTVPATAQGHVFVEQTESPADGYPILDWIVPHGCDGSPTTSITVQFPKSVPAVTPEAVPGWEVSTKEGPKDEVELFGETITEGVSEVTWTVADAEPIPDDQFLSFGAELKLPAEEGETLYFPTIQKCEKGETRWIQIPAEGETEEDLEEPAPAVTLTAAAAEGEHAETTDEAAPAEEDEGAEEETEEGDDDFASKGLGIAALVLGGIGALLGAVSLLRKKQ